MKKLIALLLVVVLMASLCACKSSQASNKYDVDYGFDDVVNTPCEKWIRLESYDENNGEYVLTTSWQVFQGDDAEINAHVEFLEFENGFCTEGTCIWEDGMQDWSYDDTCTWNAISNDRAMIDSETLNIQNRVLKENMLIIVTGDGYADYYIPWELIDWERSPEVISTGKTTQSWERIIEYYQCRLYIK